MPPSEPLSPGYRLRMISRIVAPQSLHQSIRNRRRPDRPHDPLFDHASGVIEQTIQTALVKFDVETDSAECRNCEGYVNSELEKVSERQNK
jgi:hypothetical protein